MGAPTFPKKPFNLIVTLDRHEGLFFPSPFMPFFPVVPGFGWHIGAGMEVVSKAIWSDKWNDDVKVDGQPICSVGNAVGLIIPHWHLFPVAPPVLPGSFNLLMPILILMSTSTNFMAVGSIVAKNGPIAVTIPYVRYVGTNLACNDPVPMPTDIVVHTGSSVVMGFTWGDLLAAAVRWAVAIAVAYVTKAITKVVKAGARRGASWAGSKLTSRSTNAVAQRLGRGLTSYGAGSGPGLAKRAFDRMVGNHRLPLSTPAGQNPLDRFFGQKYLDNLLGTPSASNTLADKLAGKLPGVSSLLFKSGVISNPLSSGAGGLSDLIGSYVDGRSEELP